MSESFEQLEMLMNFNKIVEYIENNKLNRNDMVNVISECLNGVAKSKLIKRYEDRLKGDDLAQIISSYFSGATKNKLIKRYHDKLEGNDVAEIISSCELNVAKSKLIKKYKDELEGKDIEKIIKSYDTDKSKSEMIKKYKDELEGKDIAEIIKSCDTDKSKSEMIKECKDKLEGKDIAEILDSYEILEERSEIIDKYEGKLTAKDIIQISQKLDISHKQKILQKHKSKIDDFTRECFDKIGEPVDNFEELLSDFGGCIYDNLLLLTKESEAVLGKDNLKDLVKYYAFGGEIIDITEIIRNPEIFKKYEAFRKDLYEEKQMKIMNVNDSIMEFNGNSKLIEQCVEGEMTVEEKNILKSALKEKNVKINDKKDLPSFAQKRKEKYEEMINDNPNDAITYILTGMSEEEYDKKYKLYFNEQQIDSTIRDFDELDPELAMIKAINEFINLIKYMDNETQKEVLNIYNNDLADEFSPKGSVVANARDSFEDIDLKMRKIYGNELAQSLVENKLPNSKTDKDVEVIELKGEKFNLLIHGIDAYGDGTGRFEKREVGQAYICTSLISDKKLARAEAGRYYGFRNIGTNSLVLSGKNDIYSVANAANSVEVDANRHSEFVKPDELSEGNEYNEIVLWREYLGDDGTKKEIWPEYIVCFNEITNEDREEAKCLNIPIVLIDEKSYSHKKESKEIVSEEKIAENPKEYMQTKRKFIDIFKNSKDMCSALEEQAALGKFISEMEKQMALEKEGHAIAH